MPEISKVYGTPIYKIKNFLLLSPDRWVKFAYMTSSDVTTDYAALAIAMTRNITVAVAMYYVDWNVYPSIIDDLVEDEYISSVTLDDTGKFNYYTSSDRQFSAWWEGGTRTVSGSVGRYSADHNGESPVFRSDGELTTWISGFPA